MIREFQKSDIERLADIWLDTNLNAHNFIPSQYWLSKLEMVKEMFLQAEIYVCEKENEVQGFIGLYENYIWHFCAKSIPNERNWQTTAGFC